MIYLSFVSFPHRCRNYQGLIPCIIPTETVICLNAWSLAHCSVVFDAQQQLWRKAQPLVQSLINGDKHPKDLVESAGLRLERTPHLQMPIISIASRKRRNPSTYFLCQCWECFDSTSIAPDTITPVNGRYLGAHEFKRHQSQLKQLVVASLWADNINIADNAGAEHQFTDISDVLPSSPLRHTAVFWSDD